MRIAVLVTVYNRKEITIKGLESLRKAIDYLGVGYIFDIYLTDDGSTDGTGEMVSQYFPQIIIIKGDGSLFWAGGMIAAWNKALESKYQYDFFLWYNDDSFLYEKALSVLFETYEKCGLQSIVTGAFCDRNGNVSYGGKKITGELIEPNGTIQEISKMNGNLVLISEQVFSVLGKIDSIFRHSLGDTDYGFRAQSKGIHVYLTPEYVGTVNRNERLQYNYFKKELPLKKRIELLNNPKNSPLVRFKFNKRHYGLFYAIRKFLQTYVYVLIPQLYKAKSQ